MDMHHDDDKADGSSLGPAPPARGNDAEQREYTHWVRRFVRRLRQRLPDEPPQGIEAAVDRWSVHYRRLAPDDAAEVAAMWWHPKPVLRGEGRRDR